MSNPFGTFVGRFCPVHLGHEAVIRHMIKECGEGNCLLVIGSSTAPMTFRNLFSFEERKALLRTVFPNIPIEGIPDHPSDEHWLVTLEGIIQPFNPQPHETVFFGGCEEDVRFFVDANRRISLMNRFDGSTPKISATEVRDALVEKRSIDGLVNPLIQKAVREIFAKNWDKFKRI